MAIIELARYRLVPGADPEALAQAEQAIQSEVGPTHPGYLGRELLHAADGSYVLIMRWESEEASATWNKTLFASAAGQKLGPLVDRASMSLERLMPVKA
jgi:heme-degrading monooxygenase HmoA